MGKPRGVYPNYRIHEQETTMAADDTELIYVTIDGERGVFFERNDAQPDGEAFVQAGQVTRVARTRKVTRALGVHLRQVEAPVSEAPEPSESDAKPQDDPQGRKPQKTATNKPANGAGRKGA